MPSGVLTFSRPFAILSFYRKHRYQDPDKTYIRILERFPGVTLNDFNGMLKAAKLPELGTKEKVS